MHKTNDQVFTILVTGSSGFIGQHLLGTLPSYFRDRSLQIRVLGRSTTARQTIPITSNIDFIQGDITDSESLKTALEGADCLFHLAAKTGIPKDREDEKIFWQTNVEGTKKIARLAATSNVKIMINLSSSSVYGEGSMQQVLESSPTNPNSIYGITKLAAEQAAESEAAGSNMRLVSVRPSNVFGEDSSFNVLLNMMRAIKNGRFFLLRNSGQAVVNYVYVGDVVDAIIRLSLLPEGTGQYNVNTPERIQVFAATIAYALGVSAKFVYLPYSVSYTMATFIEILGNSINQPLPITRNKIQILANKKQYSPKKLQTDLVDWPRYGLFHGINRLVQHYAEKGYL